MTIDSPGRTGLVDVRPVAGHAGAEIHGVDLRDELDDAVVAEIRTALLRWKVVFFRDQQIGPAEHVAFAKRFGEPTPAHPTLPSLEGYPEVLAVDSRTYTQDRGAQDRGTRRAAVPIENGWHTDVTFVPNPPMGSILSAVVVPPYGGDTSWTNLVAAYEALSQPIRDLLDGLQATHRNHLLVEHGLVGAEQHALVQAFRSKPLAAVHPVVRVHPETGERALFAHPGFTSHIQGLKLREGRRILEIVYDQLSNPDFTVRFRWEPGSVAFWDNRATAHRGPGDVAHLGFDRVLHRITLRGDLPVGPDGFTSHAVEGDTFA